MTPASSSQPSPSGAGFFAPRWFALWLLVGLTISFPAVMAGLESFCYRDYGVLAYPTTFHYREALWRGEFPLWNPLSNCGAPFMAQWGTMTLYPGMLFCALLPLPWSLSYFCLGHLLLAGLGMYHLARRWTGSPLAAAVAGWAFVFNGATFSCVVWPNYLVALGWMPWVVLGVEKAAEQGGRAVLLASLAAALQVLSGVPELVVLTWAAVLALFGVHLATVPGQRFRRAARLAMVVGIVAGLTAVQILPFLDLLGYSQREPGFTATKWAMPPWGWANLLAPLFHCFETPQGPFFQEGQAFLSSYYPGVTVLVLALWGLWLGRTARARTLGVLLLLSLVLALGESGHLYAWLKGVFPALSVARFPVKFVLLATFLLPLLGAGAVKFCLASGKCSKAIPPHPDPLPQGGEGESPAVSGGGEAAWAWRFAASWVVAAGLIVLIILEAYHHPFTYDQPDVTRNNALVRLIFLAAGLGLLFLMRQVRFRGLACVLFFGVLLLDVLTHTARQNPSLKTGYFQPGLWEADQKATPPRHGEGRVLIVPAADKAIAHSEVADIEKQWIGKRLALWSHLNLVEQTPKVNGSSTLQIREQKILEDLFYKPPMTNALPAALLDFLGVKYITAPGKIVEWTNRTTALPLITAGQQPEFLDETEMLDRLKAGDFDPRATVFLPAGMSEKISVRNRVAARVENATYTAHRIAFTVDTPAPCLVVAAQSYYHNWQARVGGEMVPLYPANFAFQTFEVPAGRHAVTLTYEDQRFRLGLIISLVTLAGMVGMWFQSPKAESRKPKEIRKPKAEGAAPTEHQSA